jgi:hypothetical protein
MTETKTEKILLLHPKGMDADALQNYRSQVSQQVDAEIVLAVEDYAQHFEGSWRDWTDNVHKRYDGFLVLTQRIGRANSDILRTALELGLTVARCVMSPENRVADVVVVSEVVEIDKRDWKTGWEVR